MSQDKGASGKPDRAAGLRPQPRAASSQSSIPSAARPDGTKSRLHRRIDAARSLANDLAEQGHARMAQVIRELCVSASASSTVNAQLHRDLAAALANTKDGQ